MARRPAHSLVKPRIHSTCLLLLASLGIFFTVAQTRAGEFSKDYYAATPQGAWSAYRLAAADGSEMQNTYTRQLDEAGRVSIRFRIKPKSGPAAGSDTKLVYVLPENFAFERDGMSYGKFVERMTMEFNGMQSEVDAKTLQTMRDADKDWRKAVTFEATEEVAGRSCDRYSYTLRTGGGLPTTETGTLWLDATLPFAVVKHSGKAVQDDGTVAAQFEMLLTETGLDQSIRDAAAVAPQPAPVTQATPPPHAKVTLAEGYEAGKLRIGVEVVAGSKGRQLQLTLTNKTEGELTVSIPGGDTDIQGDLPVEVLRLAVEKAVSVTLEPEAAGKVVVVTQRPGRGATEGKFELSVYEGSHLFSGSATADQVK